MGSKYASGITFTVEIIYRMSTSSLSESLKNLSLIFFYLKLIKNMLVSQRRCNLFSGFLLLLETYE